MKHLLFLLVGLGAIGAMTGCRNRCCGPCGACGGCAGGACATYGAGGMTPMYGGAQPTYGGGGGFVPPQGSLDSSFYSPYTTAQGVSPMVSSTGPITTTTMSPVVGTSPVITGAPIASPMQTTNPAVFAGRVDSLPTYR
ncbi:MAG TPA: hypothetical protein VHB77_14325 [Planctomycetaceae bacterium]|nr:hypothetical protein [Planctomycetaceae bacterium]